MQETQVHSLYQEHPLEEEMGTHRYSRLENPLDKGARQAKIHGVATELDTTEHLNNYFLQPSASQEELHWPSKPWRKRLHL